MSYPSAFSARGEICRGSVLHGKHPGIVDIPADTLEEAIEEIRRCLAYDHEGKDHAPTDPPTNAGYGYGVTDGDWTYWIDENLCPEEED